MTYSIPIGLLMILHIYPSSSQAQMNSCVQDLRAINYIVENIHSVVPNPCTLLATMGISLGAPGT